MRRNLAIAGVFIGLSALLLQFFITVPASMDAGRSPLASIVFYFSFFTILTNLLLVLIYLGALIRGQRWLMLFRRPRTRATAAAAITLVMGFYALVLADLWAPEGLFWLCDVALHYVAPILYLVWFAGWNRSGTLRFGALPAMLAYPVVYLAYALARGALTGDYPYPVLDAQTIGYAQVTLNSIGLLVVLVALCAVAVAIDRSLLFWGRSK